MYRCMFWGCKRQLPPRMTYCPRHWDLLPADHRTAVRLFVGCTSVQGKAACLQRIRAINEANRLIARVLEVTKQDGAEPKSASNR
jgi:hypothetical protein